MRSELKRISRRLLLLGMLMGCLALLAPSRTAYAWYHCDVRYGSCMNGCGQPIDAICASSCSEEREICENGPPWIE